MKIYKTEKGYYYKELNSGKKIRITQEEWSKLSKDENVIFYDDSIYEIQNSKKYKNIITYYVKDNLDIDYNSYLKTLTSKTQYFVKKLNEKYNSNNIILKGIPIKILEKLNEKVINSEINKIVFDWDFTLSIFEGWFSEINFNEVKSYINDNQSSIKNYAEYILGGLDRINILKSIFNNANKCNIPIFVLTNNIGLNNPYKFHRNRLNFYNLLKSVKLNIKIKNIYFNTYQPGNKLDFINEIILNNGKLTFNKVKHNIFMTIADKSNKESKKLFYKYYKQLLQLENKYPPSNQFINLKNKCLIEIYK